MSANRKLQTEVVQVLKKVEEGVQIFEEIWDKVYSAGQQSLKEKYESDLKKEIKKLQRLRDQIKSWLGSTEVKDKGQLLEARKLIEAKMELFKICEKDTKTKAYSKEGLAREAINDPKESEREEKRNWLNECLQKLGDIVDSVEVEIEKASAGRGKAKNKENLEKLENRLRKNKWHITRLEQILRLLDSLDLDPSKLDGSVKDNVEYYLDSAMEDDGALGVDDEFDVYEELQLDQITAAIDAAAAEGVPVATILAAAAADNDASEPDAGSAGGKTETAVAPVADSKSAAVSTAAGAKKGAVATAATIPVVSSTAAAKSAGAAQPRAPAPTVPLVAPAAAKPTPGAKVPAPVAITTGFAAVAAAGSSSAASTVAGAKQAPATPAAPVAATAKANAPVVSAAAIVAGKKDKPATIVPGAKPGEPEVKKTMAEKLAESTASPVPTVPPTSSWSAPLNVQRLDSNSNPSVPAKSNTPPVPSTSVAVAPVASTVPAATPAPAPTPAVSSPPTSFEQPLATVPPTAPAAQLPIQAQPQAHASAPAAPIEQANVDLSSAAVSGIPATSATASAKASAAPSLPQDSLAALNMLRFSMLHTLDSTESDKQAAYNPRNPFPGAHPSFPQHPAPQLDNPALFERLPPDALFFAFYNQPGSYQQYLAARQLKKLSWRFHKKYMTWFQRHEEPKVTSEEFEEGTYVYFDYDSGWCQRIKSEFKFEYAYLEDEVQTNS